VKKEREVILLNSVTSFNSEKLGRLIIEGKQEYEDTKQENRFGQTVLNQMPCKISLLTQFKLIIGRKRRKFPLNRRQVIIIETWNGIQLTKKDFINQ
jgi:hypothetical protein